MMNLKLCPKCNKIIRLGHTYCPECEKKVNSLSARNYKDRMDKEGIKRNSFYKSTQWIHIREFTLMMYNYIDIYDYLVNKKVTKAVVVHHITEVKDDWYKRLELGNLIPLSKHNHYKIHQMYKNDKANTMKLLYELKNKWNEEYKG